MVKIVVGKSKAMLGLVGMAFRTNPSGWMGPLYIGACLDFFFLGILFCQVRFYYSNFPKDSLWIKRLVASIVLLCIVKTIISFMVVWDKNILGFGDWRVAATVSWGMWLEIPVQVFISTVAQTFFVWRAFILTGRNWYLLAVMIALMMSILGISIALGVFLALDPYNVPQVFDLQVPMLINGVIVDIAISAVVSYKLAMSRRGFSKQTDRALTRLLAITWECAAPPALSQVLNLIFFFVAWHSDTWSAVFNMLTPRLYAFSLLHTLNSRITVRSTLSQGQSGRHEGTGQSGSSQPTLVGSSPRGKMVFAKFNSKGRTTPSLTGTLPIHVQTDTVVHTAPTDPHGHTNEKPRSAVNHAADAEVHSLDFTSVSESTEDIQSAGTKLGAAGTGHSSTQH